MTTQSVDTTNTMAFDIKAGALYKVKAATKLWVKGFHTIDCGDLVLVSNVEYNYYDFAGLARISWLCCPRGMKSPLVVYSDSRSFLKNFEVVHENR